MVCRGGPPRFTCRSMHPQRGQGMAMRVVSSWAAVHGAMRGEGHVGCLRSRPVSRALGSPPPGLL